MPSIPSLSAISGNLEDVADVVVPRCVELKASFDDSPGDDDCHNCCGPGELADQDEYLESRISELVASSETAGRALNFSDAE
jgi:hypothetical protein